MRRTLANHQEVAHYWANKVQEEGHGANVFFISETIYSYGHHFPIAKHYDNDLILFTTRDYSVTTSCHISMVRQAIPSNKNILHCYNPEDPKDKENLTTAISEIEYNLKKAIKARQRKQDYLRDAERSYNDLISLITRFKIKGWKVPKYDFSKPETVTDIVAEKVRKEDAKRKREAKKQAKQDKLDMVEFLEDVEIWKAGKISAYQIKHRYKFSHLTDHCRINGDIVETTRSANAPVKEVKIMLQRIKQGKPVKGLKLGHYTVISYDSESLTVGCHNFKQSELDYLMKELKLNCRHYAHFNKNCQCRACRPLDRHCACAKCQTF